MAKLASWGSIEMRWEGVRVEREPRILSVQVPKSQVLPLRRGSSVGLMVSRCVLPSVLGVSQIFSLYGSQDIKKRIPPWASLSLSEVVARHVRQKVRRVKGRPGWLSCVVQTLQNGSLTPTDLGNFLILWSVSWCGVTDELKQYLNFLKLMKWHYLGWTY